VNQQESSYFDPEEETLYRVRDINQDRSDARENQENHEEQEQPVHYVTPEQSMLRGEKLIPIVKTKPYANWFATAVFVLMILIGGLIWGTQVRVGAPGYSGNPGYGPPYSGGYGQFHEMHHQHYVFPGDQDGDR
jgi:hypothetical protein